MTESRQVRRQRERIRIKEMSSLNYPMIKLRPVQTKGKDYSKFPDKKVDIPA